MKRNISMHFLHCTFCMVCVIMGGMKKDTIQNPFVHGKVVRENDFFNRASEKERLIRLLMARNNILVTGDRRVGKTSLLLRCFDELAHKNLETFYFNLDPITSLQAFVERYGSIFTQNKSVAKRAIDFLKVMLKGFNLDIQLADDGSPTASINWKGPGELHHRMVQEILNLPQELAEKYSKRFVICFDEFQIARDLDGTDLIAEMRSAFQRHDRITYVFMGSEASILNRLFNSPKEKFFNSAVKFHLGLISRSDFTRFIQSKFAQLNISVPDSVCELVCEWGTDIPAHIQHLCSAIWNFYPAGVKIISKDVIEKVVIQEIEANDELYLQMWQTIGDPKDQILLKRLAHAKGLAISGTEFCAPLSMNPATVTRRLNKIASRTRGTLIHLRSMGYVFSDPFFERWILQKT